MFVNENIFENCALYKINKVIDIISYYTIWAINIFVIKLEKKTSSIRLHFLRVTYCVFYTEFTLLITK